MCAVTDDYDWCQFNHTGLKTSCRFDFINDESQNYIKKTNCTAYEGRAKEPIFSGEYLKNTCGMKLYDVKLEDAGDWARGPCPAYVFGYLENLKV